MSLLEHPAAQSLLADAEVSADGRARLSPTPGRVPSNATCPASTARNNGNWPRVVLQGKLQQTGTQDLRELKPTSPVLPPQAGAALRRCAGGWDDEAVMAELRQHVGETLADPDAVLVLDPSSFPKKGDASRGAARQWCGRQ